MKQLNAFHKDIFRYEIIQSLYAVESASEYKIQTMNTCTCNCGSNFSSKGRKSAQNFFLSTGRHQGFIEKTRFFQLRITRLIQSGLEGPLAALKPDCALTTGQGCVTINFTTDAMKNQRMEIQNSNINHLDNL